jgi:glycosyltransferase involved in cell wall biosynthesis
VSKRYLFDARHVPAHRDDGAARVVLGALQACAAQRATDEELVVLALPDAVDKVAERAAGATVWSLDVAPASLRQLVGLGRVVDAVRPDAYFFPQYDLPLLSARTAAVSYIHDVTPIVFDRYFGRPAPLRATAAAALLAATCARSRVVLCNSRFTAQQVRELVPSAASRVQVCAPGPTALPDPGSVARASARFVYVGNHRPHKRLPHLLAAFARARPTLPRDAELLLIGRPDPRFDDIPALLEGPLGKGVRLVDDADDAQIAKLIASARALVFPSTGEGFGMPVLEAYGVGTPAILADAGALAEVAGDAAILVPPLDEDALADALVRLARDDRLFDALAAQTGRSRARFSWHETGRVLLQALRSAAA